jgi:hypothetical protein
VKTLAHYDANGNITALITGNGPDSLHVMVTPKPGQFVAQVEGIAHQPGMQDVAALREAAKKLHVTAELPVARSRRP